ncbi:MAG TPA: CvpA family protein, partial [Bacilli bacterium]|nr:CvpA family protein [Bacilli bacterium]
ILGLLLGAVLGFKRGIIKSAVMFGGTILVIVLAYLLKNPISIILYTYLPFFKLGGIFQGVSVINILIYEAIAFLITFAILMLILKIIIAVSTLLEKILNATVVLGIPSKILGALFGICEAFLFIFVGLYAIFQFNLFSSITAESKYATKIVGSTPVLSNAISDTFDSFREIYDLQDEYATEDKNSEEYNEKALDILLKNEVISPASVRKLVEKGKIDIDNVDSILERYED